MSDSIDYVYKGKTNHFFTNGVVYKVEPDSLEHVTKDDTNDSRHELSDDYLSKNFVKVFTQAMCDAGDLPSVGMECNFSIKGGLWQDVTVNYVGTTLIVLTSEYNDAQFSSRIDESRFKPLTLPTELIDGRAYQFDYKNRAGLHGIYCESEKTFITRTEVFHYHLCTNITLLTPEGK